MKYKFLQNLTSISFLDCTQIKLIALLLAGMLISHINLTQNITPLYLRSFSMHMHNARKQLSQIPDDISTKTPGIQFRNSAPYSSFMSYPTTTHRGVLKHTSYIKMCLKVVMFRSSLFKRERWTVLSLPWKLIVPIAN